MAMTIMNDASASMTLGELNKNISELGKQLKKVSSGMRINGAGDGPSEFSISEKMRVRIRALDQDERNVLNGAALLRTAEGAIQSQIEIMKTIKQKAIDADNDTNTDLDRMTIQKEIDQGYRQIEDIAWETNYNGKRLLVGDTVYETVRSWVVNGTSSLLPGSDEMNIINAVPDVYDTLNGVVGPFDLFTPSKITSATVDRLGSSSAIQYEGGVDPTYRINGSYTVDSLDGKAFYFYTSGSTTNSFVLRNGASDNHLYGIVGDTYTREFVANEIDISDCATVADVMERIANKIPQRITGYGADWISADMNIKGSEDLTGYEILIAGAAQVPSFSGTQNLSGGANQIGVPYDVDSGYQPAKYATLSLPGVVAGTGITIDTPFSTQRVYRLRFVEGDGEPVSADGVTTVGVDYADSFSIGEVSGVKENGTWVISATSAGDNGNGIRVKSGIEETTLKYWGAEPLEGELTSNDAYATLDVSGYTDVEQLIEDLKGKAIARGTVYASRFSAMFENGYPYDSSYYEYIEFVDSVSDDPIDRMYKIQRTFYAPDVRDLDRVRWGVRQGKSIAEAFSDIFLPENVAKDSSGNVIGVKFKAKTPGAEGNEERLFLVKNNLRSYALDYGKWFADNPDKSIPEFLNGKGFRAYCASCANEWFNFCFYTGELPEGRPQNADPESEDIKPIYIDVSGVTDATSLVQAIYDQATPYLEGESGDYNHFMRLIADGDKLIIYDNRRYTDSYLKNVDSSDYDYQWDETEHVGGAKIADGVWDNVVIGERDIYVKDLVIHHTDHASQNIHVKIPQTTMDHLFGYQAGTREWSEFNVMTAASREELLGNKVGYTRSGRYVAEEEEGLLDHALNYLTAANCLVGAQISRLEMTEANIVTSRESTTSSESTIRDADMAKEMTEYTKANVLAQAAQSMLAQANQDSSTILGLLQ